MILSFFVFVSGVTSLEDKHWEMIRLESEPNWGKKVISCCVPVQRHAQRRLAISPKIGSINLNSIPQIYTCSKDLR